MSVLLYLGTSLKTYKSAYVPKNLSFCLLLLFVAGYCHAQRFMSSARRWQGAHSGYSEAVRGGYQKYFQRISIAFIKPFSGFQMDEHFTQNAPDINVDGVYQANPKPNVDTTVSRKGKLASSWGVETSVFCPVGTLSDNSCLDISFGGIFMIQNWTLPAVSYSSQESTLKDAGGTATVIHGMIPVSVDYRYGGDAVLDKEKRFMFASGVGITGEMSIAGYGSTGNGTFKALPFVKVEFGFFAGIAFKLRAMAFMGKYNYFKDYTDDRFVTKNVTTYDHTDATAYGGAPFLLSLAIMPYSFHWGDEDNVGKERW